MIWYLEYVTLGLFDGNAASDLLLGFDDRLFHHLGIEGVGRVEVGEGVS